ncbi:hypothetical protein [Clostridium algidicarnis]|uniref:hypothetical protein n=1 Tax=Clostridium algidicarnis TaxID=37659 RepID=UPI001C0C566C|nr:hypothetical protein [Clostridium algidicarnis]MBU3229209.1 hypothetical protein [Clostridium algidicarnis]MBU3252723.1 hypothetical protein [Clostridium algidicarnis]
MIIDNLDIKKYDDDFYMINNMSTNKYIKLGIKEFNYLLLIKGEKTYDINQCNHLSKEQKEILLSKFEDWGFTYVERNNKFQKKRMDFSNVNIISFEPSGRLYKILNQMKRIVSPITLIFILGQSIICGWIFVYKPNGIIYAISNIELSVSTTLILYVMNVITGILHELAHATACLKYTSKVGKMGIKLFYLYPSLYTYVSSTYLVRERRKQLVIASSGLCVNVILGMSSLIGYIVAFELEINIMILFYYFVLSIGSILYNLLPFIKLDGYWILKAFCRIDNLYDKSIILFLQLIYDFKGFCKNNIVGKKKFFMTFYGGVNLLFHLIFWSYSIRYVYLIFNDYVMGYLMIIVFLILGIIVMINSVKFLRKYNNIYKKDSKRILSSI